MYFKKAVKWQVRLKMGKACENVIKCYKIIYLGMSFLDLIKKIFNALCEAMKKSR